jgi:hypothetical protein
MDFWRAPQNLKPLTPQGSSNVGELIQIQSD